MVNEMRRCVSAQTAGLWRYESSGEFTKLAAADPPAKWPVGSRLPVDGNTLAAVVQRTGRRARMYSHEAGAVVDRFAGRPQYHSLPIAPNREKDRTISLAPRDAAELCLALEVHHRLI